MNTEEKKQEQETLFNLTEDVILTDTATETAEQAPPIAEEKKNSKKGVS